ncbi:hypothetical protein PRIPAC_89131 [Pristionchus pacificus]|nr:hypothetical protein PRIPAC_89131 [Pristionchus pacificus]
MSLRIRDQLSSRPSSPIERFVKNVEFAARFGPSKAFRPLNLDLSIFQFHGIDLIFLLIGSILLSSLSIIFILKMYSILSIHYLLYPLSK